MFFVAFFILRAPLLTQMIKNPPVKQETEFNPWVGKIPWRREWKPTTVFLPGKSRGQWSLAGYTPWGRKTYGHSEGRRGWDGCKVC